MPERISDNWVGVISIDTASRSALGIWNEPFSSRLMLASQCPRFCGVKGIPGGRAATGHEPPDSIATVPDDSWE